MDAHRTASELAELSGNPLVTSRNPLAPGSGRHTVAMLWGCANQEYHGVKDQPAPRATEGIPVLAVMDAARKWVTAALGKFGDGDGDRVISKENFQSHFLPERIFWHSSWPGWRNSQPRSLSSVTRMNSSFTSWMFQDVSLEKQLKMKINGRRETQSQILPHQESCSGTRSSPESLAGRLANTAVRATVERIRLPWQGPLPSHLLQKEISIS